MRNRLAFLFAAAFSTIWSQAVPLHITPGPFGSGKAYVECAFDGVVESCFMDTGSAMTLVPHDFAGAALGTFRFKTASGRSTQAEVVHVSAAKIDQKVFNDVRLGRLPKTNGAAQESTVGMDFLGRGPFAIEFRDRPALRLGATAPREVLRTLRVAQHGLLSIPIECGALLTEALIDTGATVTAVDLGFVRAHPEEFKPMRRQMKGVDGGGHSLTVELYHAKSLSLGPRKFRNIVVVATDLSLLRESVDSHVEMVLGFNIIRKTDWYFDPANKLWSVR